MKMNRGMMWPGTRVCSLSPGEKVDVGGQEEITGMREASWVSRKSICLETRQQGFWYLLLSQLNLWRLEQTKTSLDLHIFIWKMKMFLLTVHNPAQYTGKLSALDYQHFIACLFL